MTEIIYVAGQVIVPIILFILSGYYASNAAWCSRKVFVSVFVGLCIGAYAIYAGDVVTDSWISVAFASAPAMGAMYIIDRVIKGAAKRYGIDWLYTDEPCEV